MSLQRPTSDGAKSPDEIPRLPMPSPNPLPLSASQEAQVRDTYYARVRAKCAAEIKAFADCAAQNCFTVTFRCRPEHRAMNSCMLAYSTPEEQDAAREEWFARRLERQRARERKARRKAEQAGFLREWWGLPEQDAEERRKELEKLKMPERVGGFRPGEGPDQEKSKKN